jgi:hypothetical protein
LKIISATAAKSGSQYAIGHEILDRAPRTAHRAPRSAIVITRTAYNVHGSSIQTADMLKKYILPALPCGKGKKTPGIKQGFS